MRGLGPILALILALPGGAGAQDLPGLYSVTGVAADDVLNIRALPDAKSEVIGALAPDATGVEVVALAEGGRWGRVNAGEQAGWAAMRFLAPDDEAPWWQLAAPLSCYGTEPFWGLQIAPGGASARLSDPNAGDHDLGPATLWDRPMNRAGLGLSFAGGFATIEARACDDGMSGREYGLSILLFGGFGGDRYSLDGCCSLAR